MTLKEWNEYSAEEKVNLLNHHYHYYGKSIINLAEMEQMRDLIAQNPDLMWNLAVVSHITRSNAQTTLVRTLRHNMIEELLRSLPDKSTFTEEEKEAYDLCGTHLLKETVETYNNPQPAKPMTTEQLLEGIMDTMESGPTNNSGTNGLKQQ